MKCKIAGKVVWYIWVDGKDGFSVLGRTPKLFSVILFDYLIENNFQNFLS